MTLHQKLIENGLFVATAESLTAGLVSSELASNPGASGFLLGGVIAYQDQVKIHQLGVAQGLIADHTAVDAEVAIQMAAGVRARFAQDCAKSIDQVIGLSTTGVAGPESVGAHQVGQVFIGLASARGGRCVELVLSDNRDQIRSATVAAALSALEDEIQLLLG